MKAFRTLLKTEARLSLRGMDMVIFAICMPVAAVILLGAVFAGRPAYAGADYTFLEQSFGAVSSIAICAGGVMGLPLVIADYRNRKILKRFRVTPVSPALLLAVQVAVYALYAAASLLFCYAAAHVCFGYRLRGSRLPFLGAYLLVTASMFSIGALVGGLAPNMKMAGVITSLLYFPMLLFSGATLPYEVMPAALQKVAGVLPLTYGIQLLKSTSLGLPPESMRAPLLVMAVLTVLCTGISVRFFRWE